ncbi:MAG: hypothetical protein WA285_04815 [Mycobacterium sp.]|uniref:hypothetical protein n=4 Tax=Mycobacterium sp. TaxID=1785 RepID=UPI003BB6A474
MSTVRTLLRATAVVVGSSAALLMGGLMGTAHADPAPVPTPNIGEQLAGTAAQAPQALQNLAGALGGQPATPPPLASASIKMPQQAATGLPGASSLIPGATAPATSSAPTLGIPGLTPSVPASASPTTGIPGLTQTAPAATAAPGLGIPGLTSTVPAAAAPAAGPAGMLPQAQLNLPQIPGLPFPLPQQVSLPGDLTSLIGGGSPLGSGLASAAGVPAAVAPAAAPVVAPNPLLFPVSGLP